MEDASDISTMEDDPDILIMENEPGKHVRKSGTGEQNPGGEPGKQIRKSESGEPIRKSEPGEQIPEEGSGIRVRRAIPADMKYVYPILEEMQRSAIIRGTGIARRTPQFLCHKIMEGEAVIAITAAGGWAGFSYIGAWSGGEFVANSGLIVNPAYRGAGVGKVIKQQIFDLSRSRYPRAGIFSITTGAAVMKLNHTLGFEPVTYDEITRDELFWNQCQHCVNYPILQSQGRKKCLCTAMLFRPAV